MSGSAQRREIERLLRRTRRRIQLSLTLRRTLTVLSMGLLLGLGLLVILRALGSARPESKYVATGAGLASIALALWPVGRRWTLLQTAEYVDARIASGDAVTASLAVMPDSPLRQPIEERALRSLHRLVDRGAFPSVWTLGHLALLPGAVGLSYLQANPFVPLPAGEFPAATVPAERETPERLELPHVGSDAGVAAQTQAAVIEAPAAASAHRGHDEHAHASAFSDATPVPATDKHSRWVQELAAAWSADPRVEAARLSAAHGQQWRLDAELRRLAFSDDARARELARQALQRAMERSVDDPSAHRALTNQQALFERREQIGDLVREVQRWLGPAEPAPHQVKAKNSRESFTPTDLERVLKRLSSDERRQLAERLQRELRDGRVRFDLPQRQQVLELLDALEHPGGVTALAKELRRLASSEPSVGQRRHLESPATSLQPSPAHPRARGKSQLPPGFGSSHRRGDEPHTGPSAGRAGSSAEHANRGAAPSAGAFEGLVAHPRLELTLPLTPSAPGRARPAHAAAPGLALPALGRTAPERIEAVEQTPIPDQYREQVSRYFSPN